MDQEQLSSSSSESSESSAPTVGQLERNLSQKISALHREQLGHQPAQVICRLSDTKLTVVIEDSVTKPEKLLADEGKGDLAEQVREDIEQAMKDQLTELIQDILKVDVIDFLSDTTLDTDRAGLIVILEQAPQTRPKRKN